MIIRAGVLSDTHLIRADSTFKRQIKHCFHECDVIIHAGDITEQAVLDAFSQPIYAVHGNMCSHDTARKLPESLTFDLGRYTIGLTHGARLGHDIESGLWDVFPEVDCMIYGHTHRASINRVADVLILNPGSFRSTGRFGAPGTYGILEAGDTLECTILEIPSSL